MANVNLPMNYEGNSETEKKERREKKEIAKVTEGEVRARKKGVLGRIKSVLFADDIENVREFAISDVIIPGLKHLIVDSISMLVLGEAFGRRDRERGERVSYSTKYKYGDREDRRDRRRRSRDEKEEAEYDDIYFRRITDAQAVLDGMYDQLKEYDYVSLKDFYDLSGYKSSVFDDNWGWEDLDGVEIKRCRDGYYLTLGKPETLK